MNLFHTCTKVMAVHMFHYQIYVQWSNIYTVHLSRSCQKMNLEVKTVSTGTNFIINQVKNYIIAR